MVLGTTFERYLELSPQVLVVLVAHEVAKQGIGVRRHIECLRCRRARAVTSGDIANRVSTSFARCDSGFRQKPQKVRDLFQLDVVDLRVLPGGEMKEAAAKPVCCVGQAHKLIRSQDPTRNLDSLHLDTLLALRISAKVQAQLLHFRLINSACAIFPDLFFVLGQFVPHKVRKRLRLEVDDAYMLWVHFVTCRQFIWVSTKKKLSR